MFRGVLTQLFMLAFTIECDEQLFTIECDEQFEMHHARLAEEPEDRPTSIEMKELFRYLTHIASIPEQVVRSSF